jgi:hypothetical protein
MCPYTHERWKDQAFFEDAHEWDEVLERKKNHHMTFFKTLSIDEQTLEINRGLVVERIKREDEEARRLEEIRLKKEVEQNSIQYEKARIQREKEVQRKIEQELRRKK